MGLIDMNHSQKNQLIGFIIGILANAIGILAYILIFSKNSIALTLQDAYQTFFLTDVWIFHFKVVRDSCIVMTLSVVNGLLRTLKMTCCFRTGTGESFF